MYIVGKFIELPEGELVWPEKWGYFMLQLIICGI